MTTPQYDGVAVTIGGRDFIVPPLCLRDVKRLLPLMDTLAQKSQLEQIEAASTLIHTTLLRNYPDLTMDELDGLLDVANMEPIMLAIMQASGLKKSATTSPLASPSIGTDSTPP